MATVPTTPEELVVRLNEAFPEFQLQPVDEPEWWEAPSFHSVLAEFLSYFAKVAPSANDRQLESLSGLIVAASHEAGSLENAFDTCFLEHLRQVRAEKFLRRHLAKARRDVRRHA